MNNSNQKVVRKWTLGKVVLVGVVGFFLLGGILNILVPDEKAVEAPKSQALIDAEKRVAEKQAASEKAQAEQAEADAIAWKASPAGKLCASHVDWSKTMCDRVVNKEIALGMTKEQVKLSIGNPERVNKTTTANVAHEQWIYGDDYVYFDGGVVTGVQQSDR